MYNKISLAILVVFLLALPLQAQVESVNLENQLKEVINEVKAEVGVAVIINGKDTFTLNNSVQYPMMSVFKFHQALAVVHYLEQNKQALATSIRVKQESLRSDTYSPLYEKHPAEDLTITIKELLNYTLQLSDNNACDILFDYAGGVEQTDKYIRSLGIDDFSISATEVDMDNDFNTCYQNWTSPLEAAVLLELLVTRSLANETNQTFIKEIMIACDTGRNRLVKPLQEKAVIIGHKTGTSGRNDKGQFIGVNDIGFVTLADGQRYSIAVFVKDSEATMQATEAVIAKISEVVYDYIDRGNE